MKSKFSVNPLIEAITVWVMMILIAPLCLYVITYGGIKDVSQRGLDERLMSYALIGASVVDPVKHERLNRMEDTGTQEYFATIMPLARFHYAVPLLRYVYTVSKNQSGDPCFYVEADENQTVTQYDECDYYFVLDTTELVMKMRQETPLQASRVREIYLEPDATMIETLDRGLATVSDIYTDEFEPVKSAFAPFYNAKGDELMGVVAVDLGIDEYMEQIAHIEKITHYGFALFVILTTIVAIGIFAKRTQIKRILRQNEVAQERNRREIETLTRKNTALLTHALPPAIIERIKNGERVIADNHERVVVAFITISGFETIADTHETVQTLAMLNSIFELLDSLTENYGLERIKTNGATYMVAGGLNTPASGRLHSVGNMMVDAMMTIDLAGFHAQIGIAAGPVVAGVIGGMKYAYDLWGNTVNEAANLAKTAEAGTVLCAKSFTKLCKDTHGFVWREVVIDEANGKYAYQLLVKNRQNS